MIYTVTLNPAIDKIIYLPSFQRNVTNRMKGSAVMMGGKGTHVSINLKIMGKENTALGVCFGPTGTEILRILEEKGIQTGFVHIKEGDSRTNYLLIEDSGDCTIIADKGPQVDDGMLGELTRRILRVLADGDILVLSGDASNCTNTRIYTQLLEALQDRNLRVFVDTSGDSLRACAGTSPFLIKPNVDELAALTGVPMEALREDRDILAAIDSLDDYRIPVVAVSMGGKGSMVRWEDAVYRVIPPNVNVKNTIGCGDNYLAGLVTGFADHLPVEEILRYAAAVSAAAAESYDSVGFDPVRAGELIHAVEIRRMR